MTSPAAGTRTLPPLAAYALALGDDALILAQRLGEWVARAPQLEEDIALANIALDLLGQARTLLSYAGAVEDAGRDAGEPGGGLVAVEELGDVRPDVVETGLHPRM